MQHYSDNVQDKYGNAVSGASVLVSIGGAVATIYSDNGITEKSNPIRTASDGTFDFYAANGAYTLTISGADSTPVVLFDIDDYSATLAAGTGSALVGHALSAVGAATRTVAEGLGDYVNVAQFDGVDTTGATSSSAGIQAAVEHLRLLVSAVGGWDRSIALLFPPGVYLVDTQIDMTAIRALGVKLVGYGAVLNGTCTGKPVIDALYSRYIHWSGLTIIGDATNTPKYGIQIGVKDAVNVAAEHNFDNVTIAGKFSGAAHYNHGAETTQYSHCRFYNSSTAASTYALIMDGSNSFAAASDFVTVTNAANTNHSFNENTFVGCDFRKTAGGRTIAYAGAPARHKFIGCYGVSVDDWVIEFYRVSGVAQMELDIHCETTGSLGMLLVDNVNPASTVFLQGIKMRDHNPQGSSAIIDTTGTTRQVIFDGCDLEFAAPVSGVPLVGATSASSAKVLLSGELRWQSANTLDLSNCRFAGTIYTETATTITHTLGSYEIVRRPNSADARALEFKGETRFSGTRDGTDAANWIALTGCATGGGIVEASAAGADTDIDYRITPKGTNGRVRFGTYAATSYPAITGYMEVKDAAGTVRKAAIIGESDTGLAMPMVVTSKSADYTFVLADANTGYLHPSADTSARTWTIPANASVAYDVGTTLTFFNDDSAGVITIAITSDTMRLVGAGTTGSRTLAANGMATAVKLTATSWLISGTGLT